MAGRSLEMISSDFIVHRIVLYRMDSAISTRILLPYHRSRKRRSHANRRAVMLLQASGLRNLGNRNQILLSPQVAQGAHAAPAAPPQRPLLGCLLTQQQPRALDFCKAGFAVAVDSMVLSHPFRIVLS